MQRDKENGYDSDASFNQKKLVEGEPRMRQIDSHQYRMHPYSSIGLIIGYLQGSKLNATGTLLSSHLVLTTAHSICFIKKTNKFKKIVKISPLNLIFKSNGSGKLEEFIIMDYRLPNEYEEILSRLLEINQQKINLRNSQQSQELKQQQIQQIKEERGRLKKQIVNYDYALLKLEKAVPLDKYPKLAPPQALPVELCGYLKNHNNQYYLYESLRDKDQPTRINITKNGGLYDLDTDSGQSGAPIFVNQAQKKIIGIHKGYDETEKKNICTLMSEKMLNDLDQWRQQFFWFSSKQHKHQKKNDGEVQGRLQQDKETITQQQKMKELQQRIMLLQSEKVEIVLEKKELSEQNMELRQQLAQLKSTQPTTYNQTKLNSMIKFLLLALLIVLPVFYMLSWQRQSENYQKEPLMKVNQTALQQRFTKGLEELAAKLKAAEDLNAKLNLQKENIEQSLRGYFEYHQREIRELKIRLQGTEQMLLDQSHSVRREYQNSIYIKPAQITGQSYDKIVKQMKIYPAIEAATITHLTVSCTVHIVQKKCT